MKQYFLKASGIAAVVLMLHSSGFSQETPPPPPPKEDHDEQSDQQEIIIKKKNDKDSKITVEIKNGKVTINGKPVEEFSDDNVTVHTRIFHGQDGDAFALVSPDVHVSPFRDGWNYSGDNGDENFIKINGFNTAFLGVSSETTDGKGAKITRITEGSAAEKIALKKGDIITKINDIKVNDPEDLTEAVHKFKPEDKVTVTYIRDGKEQKATATLGKNKSFNFSKSYNLSMPGMEKMKDFEGLDRMYTPHAYSWNTGKARLGIKAQDTEDGKGVKVIDVDDESPADKAGVKEGDIITQFDGKPVNSAETLANLARENKDKSSYKINLSRDGKAQEVEVKIPKKLKTANL